jgi:Predicted sugar kinase
MPDAFHSIGLIGKFNDPGVSGNLRQIGNYLKRRGLNVLVDADTAHALPGAGFKTAERRVLGAESDLVIVIGGDGTLLNAARSLADYRVPILGVNLGRLGFLVDVSPDDLTQLGAILSGDYLEEERLLLHTRIQRDGKLLAEGDALNDVVIHKWNTVRMIDIEAYFGGRFVTHYRSDGLIIATPTGSTAYALSGGGPILYPVLDAVTLVPISPHTMSYRPIVVAADHDIEVVVRQSSQSYAQVTCDGQLDLGLVSGERIVIHRKEPKIRLIHPSSYDFFGILRAKLHWGGTSLN